MERSKRKFDKAVSLFSLKKKMQTDRLCYKTVSSQKFRFNLQKASQFLSHQSVLWPL